MGIMNSIKGREGGRTYLRTYVQYMFVTIYLLLQSYLIGWLLYKIILTYLLSSSHSFIN